ncbi:hypothetical protein [Haliea sp. E17]|uniref:hypothetical protein n=1 Tax=Haliea sp. E17 TaxID=3401576 RepID=UPI003AAF97F3
MFRGGVGKRVSRGLLVFSTMLCAGQAMAQPSIEITAVTLVECSEDRFTAEIDVTFNVPDPNDQAIMYRIEVPRGTVVLDNSSSLSNPIYVSPQAGWSVGATYPPSLTYPYSGTVTYYIADSSSNELSSSYFDFTCSGVDTGSATLPPPPALPAPPAPPAPVPLFGSWAFALLSACIAGLGGFRLRSRRS